MPTAPEFLVDFVIGGTQKGGTSALARFLGSHPEICLPKYKEVHLFDAPDFPAESASEEIASRYRKAYPEELKGRLAGDATPIYMYFPWVPPRVRAYNPAMKWILILRDPVERAISQYSMERARRWEWLPFWLALRVECLRRWRDARNREWHSSLRDHSYLDRGFYSRQISRLLEYFPKEQVLIITSDELLQQHERTLRQVYRFLGVADTVPMPPPETVFPTEHKITVSNFTRAWMRKQFKHETVLLEQLTGRALDEWRNSKPG